MIYRAVFWGVLLFLFYWIVPVKGEDYSKNPDYVRQWYRDAPTTKAFREKTNIHRCCYESEKVKTHFKIDKSTGEDRWFYFDKKINEFRQVPDEIIQWGMTGPNGEAILFAFDKAYKNKGVIFPAGTLSCFFPPRGGT